MKGAGQRGRRDQPQLGVKERGREREGAKAGAGGAELNKGDSRRGDATLVAQNRNRRASPGSDWGPTGQGETLLPAPGGHPQPASLPWGPPRERRPSSEARR